MAPSRVRHTIYDKSCGADLSLPVPLVVSQVGTQVGTVISLLLLLLIYTVPTVPTVLPNIL